MKITAMTGKTTIKNSSEDYEIITEIFVNGLQPKPLKAQNDQEAGWIVGEYDIPSGSNVQFVSRKVGTMPDSIALSLIHI
jgi:hypothetical protein